MCRGCKMDPRDVDNMYRRQGAVEVEDFEEEFNYQTRMKGRSGWGRRPTKTRPGCPGNEYKAHIYVWTTETEDPNFFSDYYKIPRYQHKVCAGCGKTNGAKLSEEYLKVKERKWAKLADPEKGVPVSRWRYRSRPFITFRYWRWENEDKDYLAARKAYVDQNGWPAYLYNSY